ncbi:hypothetical protein L2E82_38032 [Cichorium intybus]|uniref:Uncharacterized protein n=1 Tax=Cichorium intybus TaxID=13427 RepID=A0ACB9AGF4_CICIN|nr:hypothetical protein L2E82_38032 [Cichorium intybus]
MYEGNKEKRYKVLRSSGMHNQDGSVVTGKHEIIGFGWIGLVFENYDYRSGLRNTDVPRLRLTDVDAAV